MASEKAENASSFRRYAAARVMNYAGNTGEDLADEPFRETTHFSPLSGLLAVGIRARRANLAFAPRPTTLSDDPSITLRGHGKGTQPAQTFSSSKGKD
ncbi:protein of unknown function [Bradyrhizobium vignae]|uniref:Uncharacterized protein n=1 Tax=Bradyrhizobium vignae TaxID=1549949 RepID=A0A2U3PV00_9BRAD|nr:protein of unknown function [Bradyrhizobium vignae]